MWTLSRCFQIGQLAEARSFEKGFRGAWFRCKIKRVIRKKGRIAAYVVEYYDYPDEPEETIQIYGVPQGRGSTKKELMLRPQFPAFYPETKLPDPDVNTVSELIVAVPDVWSIGDLVDWFSDGCYWSGSITQIIDHDMVKITLLEPPRGEGSSYEVSCKDLRPSLDWSLESGWAIPAPLESKNQHLHARLIQPMKKVPLLKSLSDELDEDKQNVKVTPRSSLEFNQSISSHTSILSKDSLRKSEDISKKEMQQSHGVTAELDVGGSGTGKPSCSDSVSGTYVRDISAEVPVVTCAEEQDHKIGSAKKTRLNETVTLNSTACDSIESAIVDIEELVNRVKWLKQILRIGICSPPQGPTWEFLERPAVSTPK